MIKSLDIQNFQSHKETKLEFAPGVNVIIGASDSGKTAVVRALHWLVWNRPTGEEFRSDWKHDFTQIILETEEVYITRLKSDYARDNVYFLDEQEFKAFGTDVPEEITKILNLNEINLQQQHDRYFLLENSPGEVAAHFNRVAHLDQIDTGLKNVQAWIRTIEQATVSDRQQLERLNEELKQYEHLNRFEQDVEVLEDMEKQLISKHNNKARLVKTITRLDEISEQLAEYKDILSIEKPVNNILDLYARRNDLNKRKTILERLIHNITTTQEKLVTNAKNALKLEKQFKDAFPDVCPLCGQTVKKNG